MSKLDQRRTPVVYFKISRSDGADLGWVGYCEAIDESMIPALMHPEGEKGAEKRSLFDKPKVIGVHNGSAYVPYSWIRSVIKDAGYLDAVDNMNNAALEAHKQTQTQGNANDGKPVALRPRSR